MTRCTVTVTKRDPNKLPPNAYREQCSFNAVAGDARGRCSRHIRRDNEALAKAKAAHAGRVRQQEKRADARKLESIFTRLAMRD